jgi:hypothetical protein
MKKLRAIDFLLTAVLGAALAVFNTDIVSPRSAIGGLTILIVVLGVQVQRLSREVTRLQEPATAEKQ